MGCFLDIACDLGFPIRRNIVERTAVKSKEIAIVGYDPDQKILEITFRRGGVYHYHAVPQDVCQGLMDASSQGTYFHEKIKPVYEAKKVC